MPQTLPALIHRFPDHLNEFEEADDLDARYAASHREPLTDRTAQVGDGGATAAYSCLTYLPAAVGASAAIALRLPMIDVLYGARLGNVVAFAAMAVLVLALVPLALRPLALLLLGMPMTLSQAASASQDACVNGISLLFVAYVAHLAWAPRETRLTRPEIVLLALAAAAVGQCKLSFVLIPLVLLIPRERLPASPRLRLALLGAVALAAGGSFALWHYFGIENWLTPDVLNANAAGNRRFMLHDPLFFADRLFFTLQNAWWFYLDTFVGRLGWLNIELPPAVIVAYLSALGLATIAAPAPASLTLARRALCLALVLIAVGLTFAVFWLIASPSIVAMQFAAGQGFFEGIQGRYFIPFALPLAFAGLGLLRLPGSRLARAAARWALPAAAVLTCVGSTAAYAAFHSEFVVPQSEVDKIPYRLRHPARSFEGKFIHQMGSKPADDQILYVYHGKRYWIESGRWFSKHHIANVAATPLPPAITHRIRWGGEIWDPDTLFDPGPTAMRYEGRFALDSAGRIWLVAHGVRHLIVDADYVRRDGYPIVRLSAQEFRAIPLGDPIENFRRLDGQLIEATDAADPVERARVYYVDGGVKHWVTDPAWLTRRGLRLDEVRALPAALVDRISEGAPYH